MQPDQESYPSYLEAKNSTADQSALPSILFVSCSIQSPAITHLFANATAAARGSSALSGRRPKIPPALRMGITTQAPSSLLTALRDGAEPRASVKPDVNLSAIGLHRMGNTTNTTRRDEKREIFSEPPEALVTGDSARMDPAPTLLVPSGARDRYRGPKIS